MHGADDELGVAALDQVAQLRAGGRMDSVSSVTS
jgi:hypothetical protein